MRDGKRRSRLYQFEALEPRLALSGIFGGAHELAPQVVVAAVKRPKVTAGFQATGQATPTDITSNPDGSFTVTASITGSAKPTGKKTTLSGAFGSFTGTITATTGSTSNSSVIQFKKGTVNIALLSHGTIATSGSDNGTFTITGGTNTFAKATGGGTFTVSLVGAGTANPSITFQFTGKVSK